MYRQTRVHTFTNSVFFLEMAGTSNRRMTGVLRPLGGDAEAVR